MNSDVPIVVNSAVFSLNVINGTSLNHVHVTEPVTFHFRQLLSTGRSNPRCVSWVYSQGWIVIWFLYDENEFVLIAYFKILQSHILVAIAVIVHSCAYVWACVLCRLLDGYWSENGCEMTSRYEQSQHRYVECRCRHLSTFAVLMDLSDEDVRPDTLKYEFL